MFTVQFVTEHTLQINMKKYTSTPKAILKMMEEITAEIIRQKTNLSSNGKSLLN